jgi:regulator of RNase E activity RraB
MKNEGFEDAIFAHEARNSALLRVFQEKKVDLREPRKIECHFWTRNGDDAKALAVSLNNRGFKILVQGLASRRDDSIRCNVEAEIRQSIDLTMRREFIEDLVRLARAHNSIYDGWGTLV